MSVFDAYETEYALVHRPVFVWDAAANEGSEIAPSKRQILIVNCAGKVGCMSGTINITYGCVNPKQSSLKQPPEVFYSRILSYPVLVTVYRMLECHEMDIVPFSPNYISPADPRDHSEGGSELSWKSLLREAEEAGWCLFAVDVRNVYGIPFEVTLERKQDGTANALRTCIIAPGSTSRIVLPLKKFLLPEDVWSQPIPTLSDRQFVVDKSGMSTAEVKVQRELFWYREELLNVVHGRWREAGGTRFGELSLRQQRLTYPMLECLRTETAYIKLSLVCQDEQGSWADVPHREGKHFPSPNEFVSLRAEIANLSQQQLALTFDVNVDPIEYVLYEGALTGIPLGRLDPGESALVEVVLCFVTCGQFDIGGCVRMMGSLRNDGRVGASTLKVVVEAEEIHEGEA